MIYYDFDLNEEHIVLECDSIEDVLKWAKTKLEDKNTCDGDEHLEGYVVTMKLDNNDEPHEIDREFVTIELDSEPSMMAQHCTWGR